MRIALHDLTGHGGVHHAARQVEQLKAALAAAEVEAQRRAVQSGGALTPGDVQATDRDNAAESVARGGT